MRTKGINSMTDVATLGAWCSVVLRHSMEASPHPFIANFQRVVDKAVARKDRRGLQMVAKDLVEMARGLPSDQLIRLEDERKARFGNGLRDEASSDKRLIGRILKRGEIASEKEFWAVTAYVEANYADDSSADEVMRLNELLAAYEAPGLGGDK